VHPVTDTTAEIAGRLSGEQAAKGLALPVDDLLIGASAIEQGYAVATLNVRHFQMIPGLHVISLSGSGSAPTLPRGRKQSLPLLQIPEVRNLH
jgi:hypothetical protein